NLGLVDLAFTRQLAELLSVQPVRLVASAEILANMALFVPVGLFVALGWARSNVWDAIAAAAGISLAIEMAQWVAPIDRTGSVRDLLANVAGACLGFLAVRATRGHPRARAVLLGLLGVIVLVVVGTLGWGLTSSP